MRATIKVERQGFEPWVPVRVLRFSRPDDECHKSISDNPLQNGTFHGCTNGCRSGISEDLRHVIESWDDLPTHVKAAICQLCNVQIPRAILADS